MSVHPTEEELGDLNAACQRLWELDENRLQPGVDYAINVQGGKSPWKEADMAKDKLFLGVSDGVWKKPTFVIFYNLLDNYERATGVKETVTDKERRETYAFLDAIMETKPMQYIHNYLVKKSKVAPGVSAFKQMLMTMWFHFYRRGSAQNDSSGFEHVFVGESNRGRVCGLHNWIQFYIEERKGNLDYRGFIKPRRRGQGVEQPDGNERLLSVQLEWEDELKPVSTMFIGSSPEFEMALYTLCFVAGATENLIDIEQYDVMIKAYKHRGGNQIDSVFPEIVGVDE